MNWISLVFVSALFAALVNYVDKYLIEKYLKGAGIGSLILFSALIGVPVMVLIRLFNPHVFTIHPISAVLIICSGMIYVLWVLLYLYALEDSETSIISPLFQLSSIFSFILGYIFLKETLTSFQIIGCIAITLGAFILNLEEVEENKFRVNKRVLLLMTGASFLIAVTTLLFKVVAIEESFWTTSFWEYAGFVLMAVILFIFVKSYRNQFLKVVRANRYNVIGLNVLNEGLNVISKAAFNYASLLGPIALISFVAEGFQPFIVLGLGVFLTLMFPKFIQENIGRKHFIKKVLGILVIFIGTALLYINN